MSAKSRRKGVSGEQEVCRIFRAHGFEVHRSPNSGGLHVPGDVLGIPRLHIEVKRQEKLRLVAACHQAETERLGDAEPVVIFRSSREPWRAVVRLEYLLELLC